MFNATLQYKAGLISSAAQFTAVIINLCAILTTQQQLTAAAASVAATLPQLNANNWDSAQNV